MNTILNKDCLSIIESYTVSIKKGELLKELQKNRKTMIESIKNEWPEGIPRYTKRRINRHFPSYIKIEKRLKNVKKTTKLTYNY
jgi:hypothetical protein